MSVASRADSHGWAVAVVTLALLGAGLVSAYHLPSSIYPPLQFPRLVVIAHSGTLPSQTMMLTVTQPLEQAVMTVPGVRRVRSTSFRGSAEISAQFDERTDMIAAVQQAQNRIAEIRGDLPSDAELVVERLTPAAFPVLILSLTGNIATPDLYDYAQYVMRPALARVAGVGGVEVLASDVRELQVVLDPARLRAADLTVQDVADALATQNTLAPVGRLAEGGQQWLSIASGLWESREDIAAAPVRVGDGAAMRVADLGTVMPGSPDRTMLITGNGRDAASVSVAQQIGADLLSIKAGVDGTVAALQHSLPAGLRITRVYDLAEFVTESIASVRDAILIGGLLAVLVLVLFLRDLRLTAIAAITLPLAVIPTFFFMQVFGASINLMSMGGLAVAIGLVIDDAVVVVENIHRRASDRRGVVRAVDELVGPLLSSTLTSVVVFAPLGLLSGVVGQFFRALSLTLSVAVLLSLLLSLTLVPLLARVLMRRASALDRGPAARRLETGYHRVAARLVSRPWLSAAGAVALAAATIAMFLIVPTGFLPKADEGGFVIDYLTPAGTALAETDRVVRRMEAVLSRTPEIAAFSRRTGSELGLFATQPNSGDILVRLKPRRQRSRSSEQIIAELRPELVRAAPAAEIEFVQLLQDMIGDLEGSPTPVEVKIFGDDAAALETAAGNVTEMLEAVPGVVDVVGPQHGDPELTWKIDTTAAARLGLTEQDVARQLSAAWLGVHAADLRLFDRRVPVRVRLPDTFRFDTAQLPQTLLKTQSGALVPLAAVARAERSSGQSQLLRENLRQMALVTGRLEKRDLGSAVADIRQRLGTLRLPVGYSYEVGGQFESQRQSFREMVMVFGASSILVLVILLFQFGSLVPALLVLAAAPLSLGGALLLLRATGTELNVSSAMGLILLVGLIVKNGIMLLDAAERGRASGMPALDAVLHAGEIRLRPILMTTLCTLFGLAPLALGLGAGAELQRPLALAVVGGLLLSTAVTLVVLPSLYVAAAKWRRPPPAITPATGS